MEKAVDHFIRENTSLDDAGARMDALLAQIDRIPDQATPFDPLEWGKQGLPR